MTVESDATGSNPMSETNCGEADDDMNENPTNCVQFVLMLKALLTLQFQHEVARKPTPRNASEKHGEEQFPVFLDAALEYCNDPKRSIGLKDGVRTWLSDPDRKVGPIAFAKALNSVLLDFHEEEQEDCDFIYVCDDGEGIEPQESSSVGMPGIADLTLGHLHELLPENEHLSLAQWVAATTQRGWLDDAMKGSLKRNEDFWNNVSHYWVPRRSMIHLRGALNRLDEGYEAVRVLHFPGASSEASLKPASCAGNDSDPPPLSGEAEAASDSIPLGKRMREESSGDICGTKRQKVEPETFEESLSAESQCGLYAAQILRSQWSRTHAITVLLKDESLSLRWYDAQGCIATFPIDVVTQLPLLVVLILVLKRKRCGKDAQGLGDFKLENEVDGSHLRYSLTDVVCSRSKMFGRRRVTASARVVGNFAAIGRQSTESDTNRASTPEEELFFKLSWREESCENEGSVIRTARDRAAKYLGANAGDVLKHVPDIKRYEDYPQFSTRHIREHLGLGIEGARVPSVLLSERLMPLEDVAPDEFPARIWEIIRCHYLLWQLGVAHGDISLWNLMVRSSADGATHFAVLNDFDLAAIMEPGDESPSPKAGFEKMGTKPFMAVDLLMHNNNNPKRLYAHDLEAMIWCMLWFLEPHPEWTHGPMEAVGRDKIATSFLLAPNDPSDWAIDNDAEDLWTAVIDILKVWITSRPVTVKMAEPAAQCLTNHDHLLLFNAHMPYPTRPEKEEWDLGWMRWNLKVPHP